MNKGQVIGLVVTGLVVVGAVTVVQYLKKPRKNSEGFFNASGEKQYYCRGEKGNLYLSNTRDCKQGGRVVGSTWGNASGGQKGRDGSALHEGTTGMGSGTGGRG
jgi:hypothetical protein